MKCLCFVLFLAAAISLPSIAADLPQGTYKCSTGISFTLSQKDGEETLELNGNLPSYFVIGDEKFIYNEVASGDENPVYKKEVWGEDKSYRAYVSNRQKNNAVVLMMKEGKVTQCVLTNRYNKDKSFGHSDFQLTVRCDNDPVNKIAGQGISPDVKDATTKKIDPSQRDKSKAETVKDVTTGAEQTNPAKAQ
jgi:hypothetical protein